MAPGQEAEGGMAQTGKDYSPEGKREITDGNGDDEDADETLGERLWGLTEMFPEPVRNVSYTVAQTTKTGVQSLYSLSRSTAWIIFSSSIVLFAPIIFEVERAQLEEAQRSQQKQMLLGPNMAVSGATPGGGMPLLPPVHR